MGISLSSTKQLEYGLYQDAAKAGIDLSTHLSIMGRKGEIEEEIFDKDLTNSKGQKVDVFQQLLANAGIRTKGPMASTGDAFFSDPSNKVLFPEWVNRAYRSEELSYADPFFLGLNDLVTNREGITGSAYRTGIIEGGQVDEVKFGEVGEGAELPVYTIRLADKAINLYKYGGVLKQSYETVRRAALPMLARYIGIIGEAQRRAKMERALAVALNGDGNANPAPNTAGAAAWTQDDLIDLLVEGANVGKRFNFIVGESAEITQILKLAQYTDVAATARNADFRDTGRLPAPLGMDLKISIPGTVLDGSKKLLGVSAGNGLVEVYENGSNITEADKLILEQFTVITLSENLAYAKPDINGFMTKTRP